MFERGKKPRTDHDATDPAAMDQAHVPSVSRQSPTVSNASPGRTDVAVIGRSIRIDGDLRGEEDLRIEGDVNGTVQLRNNTLTIGSEGKISANVYAKSVTVDGLMEGDIYGSERVSIRKNAQVNGNITAPRVSLEDGAKFKGSIEMDPKAVEKAIGAQSGANAGGGRVDSSVKAANKSNGEKPLGNPETISRKNTVKNESLS